MIVHIIEGGWNHDGSEIIGVYANREDAEAEKEKLEEIRIYDWVGVLAYTVIGG